jgi:hypothetical protein
MGWRSCTSVIQVFPGACSRCSASSLCSKSGAPVWIIRRGLERTRPIRLQPSAKSACGCSSSHRSAPANCATKRLSVVSRSTPRQTDGCQARCCGQPCRNDRQKRLNPRKLRRRAIHSASRKASLKENPSVNDASDDLRIPKITTGPSERRSRIFQIDKPRRFRRTWRALVRQGEMVVMIRP